MKKITIIIITIIGIYLIYSVVNVNKINYVSINDSITNKYEYYLNDYLANKNRLNEFNNYYTCSSITKLYEDIRNNRTIKVDNKDYYLKKVLRESDVVVINVGMNEFRNNFDKYNMKNNYDYFNNLFDDIERMIIEIRKYAYGKVIIVGYYNPTSYYDANIDKYFYEINSKLTKLMKDNNSIYINLYSIVKENNDIDKRIFTIIENYIN